ncbi:MAG: serine hydrolase domain-containing protein [Cytophagaceae bacterium]
MKSFLISLVTALVFHNIHAQDTQKISKLLEEKKNDFAGHVIMVIKKEDSLLYRYQTGLAHIDTRTGVASASKWISSAVILSLADIGLLSLDDSIGKYLPSFNKYKKGHPTIRQCLSHTSGFPAYANIDTKNLNLSQLIEKVAKEVPLKNKPGEVFEYGELSYRITGRIAEVVSGKSWEELFQNNIAARCDMKNSTYCWEKHIPAMGSGVCTTPSDYLNFMQMVINKGMFNGQRVLSEAAVHEFFISQLSSNVQKNLTNSEPLIKEVANNKPVSYGLGTWIYNYDEEKIFQKEIFCPGARGTFPFIDACRKIYGIILCNTDVSKVIHTEINAIQTFKSTFLENCN